MMLSDSDFLSAMVVELVLESLLHTMTREELAGLTIGL